MSYEGVTDLSSDKGSFGTLLLDPHNVTISNDADRTSGGFTASDDDSVINVTTLQNALAGANVTVSTGASGSQNGDITLASGLSWSANTLLSLSAAGAININANLTATGTNAGLVLTTGGGKDYGIASDASVTLSGAAATLMINGVNYTLIHDMTALDNIDGTGLSGTYALAESLDASGTTYNKALVGEGSGAQAFAGTFAGLGHTISNLTIQNTTAPTDYWGLFGYNAVGTIRDIGIEGGSLTVQNTTNALYVGRLVGFNDAGRISNVHATGDVSVTSQGTAGNQTFGGGLVGYNTTGGISDAYATGTVTVEGNAYAGGLVGRNFNGAITNAYATGDATATAPLYSAHAGGLIGDDSSGPLTNVFATGNASATSPQSTAHAGGLVGYAHGGDIIGAHATGNAFASGRFSAHAGGLLGRFGTPSLTNAYAMGNATAISTGTGNAFAGGLIGETSGVINRTYATGTASASITSGTKYEGALAGRNAAAGTIASSFWDMTTSGMTTGVEANQAPASAVSATGLTTTQMQSDSDFRAAASDWDFVNTWAPVGDGHYAELYALTPVLHITGTDKSVPQGSAVGTLGVSSIDGGPDVYVFDGTGDTVTPPTLTTSITSTSPLGTYAMSGPATVTSAKGTVYRVIYSGNVTVVEAPPTDPPTDPPSEPPGSSSPGSSGSSSPGSSTNASTDPETRPTPGTTRSTPPMPGILGRSFSLDRFTIAPLTSQRVTFGGTNPATGSGTGTGGTTADGTTRILTEDPRLTDAICFGDTDQNEACGG